MSTETGVDRACAHTRDARQLIDRDGPLAVGFEELLEPSYVGRLDGARGSLEQRREAVGQRSEEGVDEGLREVAGDDWRAQPVLLAVELGDDELEQAQDVLAAG